MSRELTPSPRPGRSSAGRPSLPPSLGSWPRSRAPERHWCSWATQGSASRPFSRFAAGEAAADGVRVLRASGAEFEREVAYSGLHQLLLPVRDDLRGQPSGVVLEVALGFAAGPAPDRLAVANATLDVLRRADSLQATLVVIDDLQWLDRASATVLALVARRLAATRTGLIGATRSGEDDIFEHAGLPLLVVPPLDVRLSGDLLDARFPTLEVQVRQQVLSEAAGNPLALLELPISLVRAGHANRMTPRARRCSPLMDSSPRASAHSPSRPASCSFSPRLKAQAIFAS